MNRERRAVLRGVAALTGAAVGSGGAVGSGAAVGSETAVGSDSTADAATTGDSGPNDRTARQEVDTSLSPGVTLFDLNGDGAYTATVEAAAESMRDDAHPRPIHVTSDGNSTVDYAASIAAPSAETTLGGLGSLSYDYYEGPNNVNPDDSGGLAPDETFLVVENGDGRHGMYLTYDAGGDPAEEWATFDVLARMRGDTGGTSRWFEYTAVESGYDGRTFDDVVARFGEDARLVRVGVGHGNAVNPATLDLYYDNLVVDGTTKRFPVSVTKRTAHPPPF
ncbi:hypothetical protein [Halorussus aquaticus]|uniref:Uncharacterized protein n=1 Tax=Halorussus aquaticus TaxID=2953748 RepID=A0ABD5Q538_9EURY|nr:hypothetical protein [Halorussus aquaticus]